MSWKVVRFTHDNTIEAVPLEWINNNECFWPPPTYSRNQLTAALRNCEEPDDEWSIYDVIHYENNTFDSYAVAKLKILKAKKSKIDDLASDSDATSRKKRKYKMRKCISSDEDDVPTVVHKLHTPPIMEIDSNNEMDGQLLSDSEFDQTIIYNKKQKDDLEGPRSSHTSTPTSSRSLSDIPEINPPIPSFSSVVPGSNDSSKCLCCPVHSEGIKVYLQQAIKKINLVQASINQLAKDMQELKKQNMFTEVNHQKPNESLFIKQNLPATTKETLNHLEDYLNNVDNFERAVSELHLIGGATLYDFVKRMLSGLITDKLAAQFSFYGLRTKEKFSQLKVSELIIRCAKHGNFKETTTKDVEDCIKKWLRRAKERNDSYIKRKDEGNNSLQN
ncbi:hypothetical protein RI129_002856 [Pyrocoelia pectoralis]|uniref:DUF4806 domain-containing protein n=1 Tax=Pyrocoelia pectoralis TaxID=417401 RepID=A0AAN7VLE2_9COLE